MTELERLARVAVEPAMWSPASGPVNWTPELVAAAKDQAQRIIRAVLVAMREPSDVQYDALCATDKRWSDQTSTSVWQCYIDAILNEAT